MWIFYMMHTVPALKFCEQRWSTSSVELHYCNETLKIEPGGPKRTASLGNRSQKLTWH